MSRRWMVPALVALVACFSGGWFLQRRLGMGHDVYQQARLFEEVLAHVRDYHVDSLPESELYHRAIDGMLEQLHDPYAALLVGQGLRAAAGADHRATTAASVSRSMRGTGGSRWSRPWPARRATAPASVPATSSSRWTGCPPPTGRWSGRCKALRGPIGTPIDIAVRREGVRGADPLSVDPRADSPARRLGRAAAGGRRRLSLARRWSGRTARPSSSRRSPA